MAYWALIILLHLALSKPCTILSLSGGNSDCANYQAGALNEMKLGSYDIISGVSVGALNGYLAFTEADAFGKSWKDFSINTTSLNSYRYDEYFKMNEELNLLAEVISKENLTVLREYWITNMNASIPKDKSLIIGLRDADGEIIYLHINESHNSSYIQDVINASMSHQMVLDIKGTKYGNADTIQHQILSEAINLCISQFNSSDDQITIDSILCPSIDYNKVKLNQKIEKAAFSVYYIPIISEYINALKNHFAIHRRYLLTPEGNFEITYENGKKDAINIKTKSAYYWKAFYNFISMDLNPNSTSAPRITLESCVIFALSLLIYSATILAFIRIRGDNSPSRYSEILLKANFLFFSSFIDFHAFLSSNILYLGSLLASMALYLHGTGFHLLMCIITDGVLQGLSSIIIVSYKDYLPEGVDAYPVTEYRRRYKTISLILGIISHFLMLALLLTQVIFYEFENTKLFAYYLCLFWIAHYLVFPILHYQVFTKLKR